MGEFNTQHVMREIQEQIAKSEFHISDLAYTTFYYRKLIRILKDYEELVLFGSGRFGKIILETLWQEGISNVRCFCDNNESSWGKWIYDVKIFSPQEAFQCYPEACFVITPKDYENEILRQLIHMGVDIEKIVIFNIKNTGIMIEI